MNQPQSREGRPLASRFHGCTKLCQVRLPNKTSHLIYLSLLPFLCQDFKGLFISTDSGNIGTTDEYSQFVKVLKEQGRAAHFSLPTSLNKECHLSHAE